MDAKMLGVMFLSGIVILIGAIIVNIVAKRLDMKTWFDFLESIAQKGLGSALSQLNVASVFYLFLIYPLALGFLVWLCVKWLY